MNIVENSDGSEVTSRVEFTRDLMDGLKEGLSESFKLPLILSSVTSNSATFKANNGESVTEETVNVSDEDDLELLFVTYVAIGSSTLTGPKLVIHFQESDEVETEDLLINGLELHDFSGKMISTGDTTGTLKVELGGNYLRNLLRMNGILSTSNTDEKPQNLTIEKSESAEFEAIFRSVFESGEAYSLANLKQRQRTKGRRMKKIELAQRADRVGHMKRSRAAKLRWRTSRAKILRGMKKFHASSAGKRLHKALGQLNKS